MKLDLGEDQMVHIEECKTARKRWNKLKSINAAPSTANRIRFDERHFTLRLQDTEDARQHLQELARTRTELRGVGVKIDDVLYRHAILRGLSSRFESLMIGLEAQLASLSVEDLQARLQRRRTSENSGRKPR